jgi:surface antigen
MMKKKILSLLCLAGLCSMNAFASNDWFMVNTAVGNFTEADARIFKQAVDTALSKYPDNKKLSWSNPNTKAHGYVIPFNTTKVNGMRCRELKIFNEAKTVDGKSQYKFCLINGEWKVTQ